MAALAQLIRLWHLDANRLQADAISGSIRRIVVSTAEVTTLAGGTYGPYADGTGTAATFYIPYGIAVNAAGSVALVVRGCE